MTGFFDRYDSEQGDQIQEMLAGVPGYACVGLHHPRDRYNIGGVMRAVHVHHARMLALSGNRFRDVATDVQKSFKQIPVLRVSDLRAVIPYDCVPVAVERVSGAQCLFDYVHPERAFYVFGPEDSTLGRPVLDWCRDVVYVPTVGSMNLMACVNVVLYDRNLKRFARGFEPGLETQG